MKRTRDWRRFQRERIRNRRRHYATVRWAWEMGDLRHVGILSETPRPCSGPCCRQEWDRGMPPQAARAKEAERQEMSEVW